jgi:hypothetical protein
MMRFRLLGPVEVRAGDDEHKGGEGIKPEGMPQG